VNELLPGSESRASCHAMLSTGSKRRAAGIAAPDPQTRISWQTTRVAALKLPSLPFPLEPAGSPAPGCRILHGALILSAAAGTDMFVDPAGAAPEHVPDAGRFVGLPPAGDFTLAAQVRVEFASMYDAGVLLLHARDRHWAKLCFEYSPQLRPTAAFNDGERLLSPPPVAWRPCPPPRWRR